MYDKDPSDCDVNCDVTKQEDCDVISPRTSGRIKRVPKKFENYATASKKNADYYDEIGNT